ncbi:MAG: SNF2 family DNA-dependent ATPase, partial [Linnemannia gamsii]
KSAPVQVKQKSQSVESDAFSDDSGDSFDEGGRSTYYAQDRKEERALEFFNEATMLELQELSGCSKTQATGVIALRPFDNFDQMCVLLRKTKGVGERIVNSYLTTTDAIRAVDNMLKTVDRVREDLVGTLSVWCGDENGKLFESGTNSNKVTEGAAGKADGEEEDDEPGMGLLNVDVDRASTTPEGRVAMKHFIRRQPKNMAPGFQLKGYQLLGINWLALLWRKKLSGILADEMGLGKTAQVIAFLAHLKETGEEGPFLIVVPASTISNWLREFDRFCPELDVRSYYGNLAEREEMRYELEQDPTYNVIVTTYSLAAGNNDERKFLNRRNFKGIVLDEGHMIKNCSSARYKQLMSIKTSFRLLLTGTPLQNNLEELLSLMVFIMPKLFADHEEVLRTMFKVKVDATSEKSTLLSQERIIRARHMLAPFVLRRKKIHVLKDLPRKVEHVVYCDLLPAQRTLYNTIMKSKPDVIELDSMNASDKAKAAAGKKTEPKKQTVASKKAKATAFANVLMQLRKAADHPMLFRELYADATLKNMAKDITQEIEFCESNIDYVEEDMTVMTDFELDRLCKQYKSVNKFALPGAPWMEACKVQELQKLLLRVVNEDNSRVLIFSQFTMVLDILEPVMRTMGLKYLRMDGSSKVEERQPTIDSFNDDETNKVFLLSTKAGGFGINLTGANVVIMFDLDYNPHNDKQAEDRAHRVGQTRQVDVYKLIGRDTIEEQIYQLANLKLKLDQHVSQDDAKATTESSASGSSTPSAGILSLIKQSFKASHGVNSSIRP